MHYLDGTRVAVDRDAESGRLIVVLADGLLNRRVKMTPRTGSAGETQLALLHLVGELNSLRGTYLMPHESSIEAVRAERFVGSSGHLVAAYIDVSAYKSSRTYRILIDPAKGRMWGPVMESPSLTEPVMATLRQLVPSLKSFVHIQPHQQHIEQMKLIKDQWMSDEEGPFRISRPSRPMGFSGDYLLLVELDRDRHAPLHVNIEESLITGDGELRTTAEALIEQVPVLKDFHFIAELAERPSVRSMQARLVHEGWTLTVRGKSREVSGIDFAGGQTVQVVFSFTDGSEFSCAPNEQVEVVLSP